MRAHEVQRAPPSAPPPSRSVRFEGHRVLDVLVVDDEPGTRITLACALADAGHRVTEASDGGDALALSAERTFDVAICDMRLPRADGLTIFRQLRRESPSTAVILMTAFATVSDAVTALREGAYDYVSKPFDTEEFVLRTIGRIAERKALRHELETARTELVSRRVGGEIVGRSPAVVRLLARVDSLARSDAPLLISGEGGSGKKLVARTVHGRSKRSNEVFLSVDCAGSAQATLESELFGGLSPGAPHARVGKLRSAHGGTLHLDEIAEMPLSTQAKLARFLTDGTIEPLGLDARTFVDARIVATTKYDLAGLVQRGAFRADLYEQLGVLDVRVPPLRERRGDLPLLVEYFLGRFAPAGIVPPGITTRAWSVLESHAFPGNVRELASALEHAVVLSHGSEIDLEHLPAAIADTTGAHPGGTFSTLADAAKAFEKEYVERVLRSSGYGVEEAGRVLGLTRKELAHKLREHEISARPSGVFMRAKPLR